MNNGGRRERRERREEENGFSSQRGKRENDYSDGFESEI
jgi:hypothetical protein